MMRSLLIPSLVLGLFLGSVCMADPFDGSALSSSEIGAQKPDATAEIPEIKAGLELLQKNDIQGALAKFEESRKSHPEFSPAELMLAKLALQINPQSNGSAARMLIEQCIEKMPADPEAYLFLGDYNLGNGSTTEAYLLYSQAASLLQKFTGDAKRKTAMTRQCYMGLAQVFEKRKKFENAQQYLDTILKSDPENIMALQQLARVYLLSEKPAEAIAQLKKAKAINDQLLTPEAIVAMFYQNKDDKQKATEYMISALKVAPQDLNTRLASVQWLMQNNDITQAIKQADNALTIDAASEAAQLLRGNLALISKDYAKAIEMYNKILGKSPSNFAASNNLALALCESTDKTQLQRALEYAGVNAQRFQNQPQTFSTLGYVLFKSGDIDKALQALQQSLNLSRGQMSADTAYYLCAALNAKGAPEGIKQAKEILDKTIEANENFAMRAEALKLQAEMKDK